MSCAPCYNASSPTEPVKNGPRARHQLGLARSMDDFKIKRPNLQKTAGQRPRISTPCPHPLTTVSNQKVEMGATASLVQCKRLNLPHRVCRSRRRLGYIPHRGGSSSSYTPSFRASFRSRPSRSTCHPQVRFFERSDSRGRCTSSSCLD